MDKSNCSGDGRRRTTVDRGLDGGYWSTLQMSSITDSVRHKRTRTNVERLELSYLPLIAMSNTSLTERGGSSSRRGQRVGTRSADTSMQNAQASEQDENSSLPAPADENSTHSTSTQHTNTSMSKTTTAVGAASAARSSKINSTSSDRRVILFKSHSYLAVRNDEGTFFLCLALTNIFEHSKQSKIQWLEDIDEKTYKLGTVDWLDPLSIICKVHMKRVGESRLEIDAADLKRVKELLAKAIEEGGIEGDFDQETSETEYDAEVVRKKQKRLSQAAAAESTSQSREKFDAKLKKLIQDEDFFDKEESGSSSSGSSSDSDEVYEVSIFFFNFSCSKYYFQIVSFSINKEHK
jgi:hypothetical protein